MSLLFAFVLALLVVLFELYGFLLAAFSPREQRIVTPLTLAIPFLFAAGVLYGYFVVFARRHPLLFRTSTATSATCSSKPASTTTSPA